MTKQQTIDQITSKLIQLDDVHVRAIADIVQSIGGNSSLPRDLTDRELDLIAQSQVDFRNGRTMTSEQARASIDDALAELGVPKSRV